MSTYFSYNVPDPFVNASNLIDPLQLISGLTNNISYGIKLAL